MARRVPLITLSFGESDTSKTSSPISNNPGVHQGQMVGFKVTMPNFTNAVTGTLSIIDSDGDTIYTSDSFDNNTTTVVMSLNVPLIEQEAVKVTLSGAPGSDGDVTVRIYYNPDLQIP
uniref:Uncharacterized protein n=1 Tax=candidate division WOR-3 bacterium TaxID=2052148 RepID=A0A7V3KP37_UNCW3